MDSSQPFPFMKLPMELRLMVYECIPVQIKSHDFDRTRNTSAASHSFAIVSKYIDLSIWATCRKIHSEATVIMQRKLKDVLETPPRLIIDLSHNISIHKCGGPLWHISHYLATRAVKTSKNLGSIPYIGTGMGASGARYRPEGDPDYSRLARLIEMWFRNLDYQRNLLANKKDYPALELALTASEHCTQKDALYAVRQLSRVLFAEHGSFRFILRKASHLYPVPTDEVRFQEKWVIDKTFEGRGGDVVRAVHGVDISSGEFDEEWSERSYYLG